MKEILGKIPFVVHTYNQLIKLKYNLISFKMQCRLFFVQVPENFANPFVSVIIPVYNAEKYLRKCLDSVCGQTLKNIEIICVNDASTDNSLMILNEYAKKDGRIVVIDKKENEGSSFARKTAIANAKGDYIIPLDADDYYTKPKALEYSYKLAIQENSDIVLFNILKKQRTECILNLHKNFPTINSNELR